jgi:glycosyltransferase involved in cell wall biosynthesis
MAVSDFFNHDRSPYIRFPPVIKNQLRTTKRNGEEMKKLFLSVVIPTYNEENHIRDTIAKIAAYTEALPGPSEIIIADDGSEDHTLEQVKQISAQVPRIQYLKSESNRGKGHAIRQGMLLSQGQFSLLTDADLSTPIGELDKFLPKMTGPEKILIGNRKIPGSRIIQRQDRFRENMGKVFTLTGNVILGLKHSDFTCGFKVFGAQARQKVFSVQKINGWAYDAEILFLAKKFGFQSEDIPVIWKNSETTKVKLLSASLVSFSDLLKIRWNDLSGKYKSGENNALI